MDYRERAVKALQVLARQIADNAEDYIPKQDLVVMTKITIEIPTDTESLNLPTIKTSCEYMIDNKAAILIMNNGLEETEKMKK